MNGAGGKFSPFKCVASLAMQERPRQRIIYLVVAFLPPLFVGVVSLQIMVSMLAQQSHLLLTAFTATRDVVLTLAGLTTVRLRICLLRPVLLDTMRVMLADGSCL